MSVSETDRHHLLERATEALGREAAMTLAAHLPPVGDQVATQRDLEAMADRMTLGFAEAEVRLDVGLASAKRDVTDMETRMVAGFAGARRDVAELEARMELRFDAMINRVDAMKHELTADFHSGLTAQTRTYVVALVSTLIAFAGVIIAALQLARR